MSIDKLNRIKNPWRVRIYDARSQQRISKCFAVRSEAVLWEAKAKIEMSSRLEPEEYRKDVQFEEFADRFLKQHASTQMSVAGKQRYEGVIKQYLIPFFHGKTLSQIKRVDIEGFRASLSVKKSASTIFTILKTLLNKAVEWELIDRSPAQNVKSPRKNPAVENHWSDTEVRTFLSKLCASPRLALYILALNTGMRSGELFGLKWDCIDFVNGWIYIRRSFCQKTGEIRDTTKTKLFRHIPMNNDVRSLLTTLKVKASDERVFIPELLGIDPTHVAAGLRRDCKKAGVKVIRFHDLRHTFSSQFVARGGNIFELSKILGHTDIKMTQRYSHFARENGQRIANIVSFGVPTSALNH